MVEYNGNLYGTSIKSIEESQATGKISIIEIDVQGCKILKRSNIDALYMFFAPPSMEELEMRLRGRKSETDESIRQRLQAAKQEVEIANSSGIFDYILINYNSRETARSLRKILEENYEHLRQTQ